MIIGSTKTLSPVREDVTFPELTLSRIDRWPDRPAVIDGATGQQYTYTELQTLVHRFADGLQQRGYGKNDHICIMAPNCPEYVVALLAVPSLGAVFSGLNPAFTTGEAIRQVNDADAKMLIIWREDREMTEAVRQSCPTVQEIIVIGNSDSYITFDAVVTSGDNKPVRVSVKSKENVALLPYSSGTTGTPKGVMLTHHNLNALLVALGPKGMGHLQDGVDNQLLIFPLYHIGGLCICLLPALYCGATIVIYPKFDFEQFLGAVSNFRISWVAIPPPVLVRLSKDPLVEKYDLSTLKSFITGGAPVAKETIQEVNKILPECHIRQGYGMTENCGLCHFTEPGELRLGSAGCVAPGMEFKVVDPNTRRLLGPGEDGEIEIRGEYVMKGYWKRPDATAETIDTEGWQKTGDLGHYDQDGYIYLVDRLKDIIKYKAYQVAPAELEALLLTHPDVAECAVTGRPDDNAGELPVAFVVLKPSCKPTAADIYNYAKDRTASYKWLRGGVVLLQEIPKNPSGKLLRRVLREKIGKQIPKSRY